MKEELLGGLKNAIERGSSLEKAVQSMINSGYNPKEVREAADLLTKGGAISMIAKPSPGMPKMPAQPPSKQLPKLPSPKPSAVHLAQLKQPEIKKKKSTGTKILIIGLIILLIIFIGAIALIIFSPDTLRNLFS